MLTATTTLNAFIDYITKNDRVDVIALQLLDGMAEEPTAEVEVGDSTIVLPKSMVNNVESPPKGWPDTTQPDEPGGPGPDEHWSKVKVGIKEDL